MAGLVQSNSENRTATNGDGKPAAVVEIVSQKDSSRSQPQSAPGATASHGADLAKNQSASTNPSVSFVATNNPSTAKAAKRRSNLL